VTYYHPLIPDHSDVTPTSTLWIRHMNPHVSEHDLINIFSPYGTIIRVGKLEGDTIGMVEFETVRSAVKAREMCDATEVCVDLTL
jgi:RNA recognition motif-containing protein